MASLLQDSRTCYIVGGALVTGVTVLAVRNYMKRRAAWQRAERRKAYPANTVILHQIGRAPYAPSTSNFPIKLETYLRMTKIPYQNDFGYEMSSKSKTPWMTYNGEDIADTEFCIEYLNKKLHKDLNSHLSKGERAVARSMQLMVEQSLYWVLLLERWVYNLDNYKFIKMAIPFYIPEYVLRGYSKELAKQPYYQGYGRHTMEEVHSIGRKDLQALSDHLGTKAFLMGDEPCQEDCSVFGTLAQIKWQFHGTPQEKMLRDELLNLSAYCDRMRDRFWPDWDDCNTAGGTKEATK